jgi:hypothetical protein
VPAPAASAASVPMPAPAASKSATKRGLQQPTVVEAKVLLPPRFLSPLLSTRSTADLMLLALLPRLLLQILLSRSLLLLHPRKSLLRRVGRAPLMSTNTTPTTWTDSARQHVKQLSKSATNFKTMTSRRETKVPSRNQRQALETVQNT